MVEFLLKFLLKQIILAAYHDFHWLPVATKLLTAKLHSCYARGSESGVAVGNFGRAEPVSELEILEKSELESDISPPTPQSCEHPLMSVVINYSHYPAVNNNKPSLSCIWEILNAGQMSSKLLFKILLAESYLLYMSTKRTWTQN